MKRIDVLTICVVVLGAVVVTEIAWSANRFLLLVALSIGPATAGIVLGLASRTPMRHVLTWALPLLGWQVAAMLLAPYPWDWVAWFIGFVVFVAMLFSERANAFWVRLIDKA